MKKRRVLFTGLYPLWSCHFTAELNFIEEELSAGSDVFLLTCDETLQTCECNHAHDPVLCGQCVDLRNEGVRRLSAAVTVIPIIAEEFRQWSLPECANGIHSLQDLKEVTYDGFDAGMAAFSSLIDRTRSVSPDVSKYQELVASLLNDGSRVYRTACQHIGQFGFDEVAIFNGRFSATRAWVRACQKTGTPFYTHEKGGNPSRVHKYVEALPHEIKYYPERILKHYEKRDLIPDYRSAGEHFFLERPQGKLSNWESFVSNQEKDSLPPDFNPGHKNIAVYTTTDYEKVASEDFNPPSQFEDQVETIIRLVKAVGAHDPSARFYLRVHPNSESSISRWWEDPLLASLPNVSIIPPTSLLSSYALLYACDATVTWGSTMGIEATFWGKPSILMGSTSYSGIDAVYEPETIEDATGLILNIPPPKDKEKAIAYGSFLMTGGYELPYSEPITWHNLTFKGASLWDKSWNRESL